MKKGSKVMLCTAMFTMLSGAITSFAGEWKTDEKGYWYIKDDGSYALSEWITDKGKWYYIAGDGYMVSDAWIGDYYVGSDGSMLTDTITPDGYYVGADGVWIKGRQAEVQDNQYLDAYAAFLRAYKIPKGSSLKPQFHLLYIDGDAIPELVIALDGCHAASADLYCYAHGSVQHLGSFGDFGKFSYVQGANLFVIRRTIMEAEVKDIIIQFKIIPVFRLLISRLALIGLGVNQIIITLILFL